MARTRSPNSHTHIIRTHIHTCIYVCTYAYMHMALNWGPHPFFCSVRAQAQFYTGCLVIVLEAGFTSICLNNSSSNSNKHNFSNSCIVIVLLRSMKRTLRSRKQETSLLDLANSSSIFCFEDAGKQSAKAYQFYPTYQALEFLAEPDSIRQHPNTTLLLRLQVWIELGPAGSCILSFEALMPYGR